MKVYKRVLKIAVPVMWWAVQRKKQNMATRTVKWVWRKL